MAFKELTVRAQADLANIHLPENTYIPISTDYIFFAKQNQNDHLEGVMVYVIQDQTNVNSFITAPQGRVKVDMQKQTIDF